MYATIPGAPVPYARSRHQGSRHYKPEPHRQWEAKAVAIMQECADTRRDLTGPLVLVVEAVHPRRKSDRHRGRVEVATTRGDLDNIAKLCSDAMTKAGWARDDAHVAVLLCTRWRAALGEEPHTLVGVERVGAAWQREVADMGRAVVGLGPMPVWGSGD